MIRARITGTGSYAPERVMPNAELEQLVATSDDWIRERTGIRERRIAGKGQACSDLGLIAAERALKAAGLSAGELDMILMATCTGDMPLPRQPVCSSISWAPPGPLPATFLLPVVDLSMRWVWLMRM